MYLTKEKIIMSEKKGEWVMRILA